MQLVLNTMFRKANLGRQDVNLFVDDGSLNVKNFLG
jgi:hypothetical protein